MTKKNSLFALIALLSSLQCFGWGQKGHDITAYIAECHLTKKAKDAIIAGLDGRSLVYLASWPDNVAHSPEFAHTKTWHYKNVDADETYETAKINENGDVVIAINQLISKLKNRKNLSKEEEKQTLVFLIHFMGDLHQPMHMGHASDLGGNRIKVKFFGKEYNLHSVWDTPIIDSAHKWSYSEWQFQIDRLNASEEAKVISGTIDDWAKETITYATEIYDNIPENMSYDYISYWSPKLESMLLNGGLRLAKILNDIYGK